jgi:hypothetical protein
MKAIDCTFIYFTFIHSLIAFFDGVIKYASGANRQRGETQHLSIVTPQELGRQTVEGQEWQR